MKTATELDQEAKDKIAAKDKGPPKIGVKQPDGSIKMVDAKPGTVKSGVDELLGELEAEMNSGDPVVGRQARRLWLIASLAAGKGSEHDGTYSAPDATSRAA